MDALRRVGVLSWGEFTRGGGRWDRRTLLLVLVLAVVAGALTPAAFERGVDVEHGLYRVAATSDAPLREAAANDPRFAVTVTPDPLRSLEAGEADLALLSTPPPGGDGNTTVVPVDDAKGEAAVEALREAAEVETNRRMTREADPAAAFPVRVTLAYADDTDLAAAFPEPLPPVPSEGGGGGSGSGGNGTGDGNTTTEPDEPGDDGEASTRPQASELPINIDPPLPFKPLLLAYAFLIPMNFVVLAYGTAVIEERLNRRGEAVLQSPARPWEIVTGKTLPYAMGLLVTSAVVAALVGGGWVSVVAILPLAFVFLALQFGAALFARSFRELTFLTVFISVLVTTYAFLPAVFGEVHPVALISPITLVVWDIQNRPITWAQFLFSTLPLTLVGFVLFRLGTALYREEDLFTQRTIPGKAVDAVGRLVHSPMSCMKVSILLIPLVFVTELLLISFLFAWPFGARLVVALALVSLVEETFKAAGPVAGLAKGVVPSTWAGVLAAGMASGIGFFLAEKGVIFASLVGLASLPAGQAVFGIPAVGGLAPAPALAVLPLLLHVSTATLTAVSARYGPLGLTGGFLGAVSIHTAYNLGVLELLG